MVELQKKWNLVSVLARDGTQHTKCTCHGVASAFDGKLHHVLGIEINGIGSERRACGVLDSLIYGENGNVTGAREPSRSEKLLKADKSTGRTVGAHVNSINEIGTRQVQFIL